MNIDRGLPSFAIRIGLHTGPLVAGRINVSEATWRLIEPWFVGTPRGRIEVKNRAAVEMFFLERLRPEYSADADGSTGNERFAEIRAGMRLP